MCACVFRRCSRDIHLGENRGRHDPDQSQPGASLFVFICSLVSQSGQNKAFLCGEGILKLCLAVMFRRETVFMCVHFHRRTRDILLGENPIRRGPVRSQTSRSLCASAHTHVPPLPPRRARHSTTCTHWWPKPHMAAHGEHRRTQIHAYLLTRTRTHMHRRGKRFWVWLSPTLSRGASGASPPLLRWPARHSTSSPGPREGLQPSSVHWACSRWQGSSSRTSRYIARWVLACLLVFVPVWFLVAGQYVRTRQGRSHNQCLGRARAGRTFLPILQGIPLVCSLASLILTAAKSTPLTPWLYVCECPLRSTFPWRLWLHC